MKIENNGSSVTLKPTQIDHYLRTTEILKYNHCYIDCSVMGAGKTYVGDAHAIRLDLPVVALGPKIASITWSGVTSETQVKLVDYITYQSLRSVKGKQPKHGYLHRIDSDGQVNFSATPKFVELAKKGILLVLDEVHNIKNNSDQFKACKALTTALLSIGGKSRFAILSATPFDKEDHAVNLLRLMGFIQSTKLFIFHKDTQSIQLIGAQELINICRHFNNVKTTQVLRTNPPNRNNIPHICYRLYVEVIKPRLVSSMSSPIIPVEKDAKNGYYRMEDDDRKALIDAIHELSKASRFNIHTQAIEEAKLEWGGITKALMHIEQSKTNLLIRLARTQLESNSMCKVIIFVNFTEPLLRICKGLDKYNPLKLNGETTIRQRTSIIEAFHSDHSRRLLVANMKVGGNSINLHDTVGDRPRFTFIVPNYSIGELHQASGRAYRDGTMSKSTVRLVYGKTGTDGLPDILETSILNALARKKDVLREILDQQVKEGVKFPGEYDVIYESLTGEMQALTI